MGYPIAIFILIINKGLNKKTQYPEYRKANLYLKEVDFTPYLKEGILLKIVRSWENAFYLLFLKENLPYYHLC